MFMYSFTFSRGQMGIGSASAILMLGDPGDPRAVPVLRAARQTP